MNKFTNLPRYWLIRVYIALSVLTTTIVAITADGSLGHKLLVKTSFNGYLGVWILGCVAVVAILDAVVNDVLPDRFKMTATKEYRFVPYMGMSLGLVSMTYAMADAAGFSIVFISYWLDAFMAAGVAFLDLFYRRGVPV